MPQAPTPAESLILRGLHLLIRTTFSPNSPEAQARHFVHLQADIGPWLADYVTVMAGDETTAIVGGDTHP